MAVGRASVLALFVLLSGCAGGIGPADGGSTGTAADGSSTTTESCTLPETGTVTATPPESQPPGTAQRPADVEIDSRYEGTLSVILTDEETGTTVFARQYRNNVRIDLSDVMTDWRSHQVTVRADCEVIYQWKGSEGQHHVRVYENGSVIGEHGVP